MKTLVAYFSASGVTARVAKAIAEAAGADLVEIAPAERYTAADLNWRDGGSRSSVECKDEACRPALAQAPAAAGYDAILVGFPVWWYKEPNIVDSWLDGCDLTGVLVAPFCTSGSSGVSGAEDHLSALYPEARWGSGRRFAGTSEREIRSWLESLGI